MQKFYGFIETLAVKWKLHWLTEVVLPHADTREALQIMKGNDEWKKMYSDNEGSNKTACKRLGSCGIHVNQAYIKATT